MSVSGGKCQVLLVGGWAQPALTLAPLQQQLAVFGPVRTLILDQSEASLQAQVSETIGTYPGKTLVIGWSLGGHLLMRSLTGHNPVTNPQALRAKLAGMVCIACNPWFTGDAVWPGVGAALFAQFAEQLEEDAAVLLSKFFKLQVLGDPRGRAWLKTLQPALAEAAAWPPEQLSMSLRWLQCWDCRSLLQELSGIMFFLGRQDRLVPSQLDAVLRAESSRHEVICIDNMAHYPHTAAAAAIVQCLREQGESVWEQVNP